MIPEGLLGLWNHRSMQILVLLSLGLQMVLFVFAGIRRREASLVRRLLLWLAYLMADSTAVYALGHMSLSSVAHDRQLVAFWTPFLLLHLGGPDNITAYALQDNQLWLRHLVTLVVQVLGAAYVLKKNIGCFSCVGGGGWSLLPVASVLMFAVGSVKYGERTWALKCGSLESIRSSVQTQPAAVHKHFHAQDEELQEEFLVRRAHSMFHICKRAIVDSSVSEQEVDTSKMLKGVKLWALMEIELSLMYDILYTKAAVIHSVFGYLVRVISPLTTLVSLLLFQFIPKDGHSTSDVAITYVLLGGAIFMETISLLNALGSSWAFAFLCTTRWRWLRYAALCSGRWDRLRRAVVHLHRLVNGCAAFSRYESRRWSCVIGQYNMIHLCTSPSSSRPLLGRLANMLGQAAWWNKKHFSGTIKMSDYVKKRISDHISSIYRKGSINSLGMLRKKWGEEALDRKQLYVDGILKDSLGEEFQEGIIIWHIATDVFLAKSERAQNKAMAPDHVPAIKVLSDYMMFLLVERPYMLPGQAQNRLFQRTCENLVKARSSGISDGRRRSISNLFRLWDGPAAGGSERAAGRDELARKVYDEYESRKFSHAAPRLPYVARLAKQLLEYERDGTIDSMELLLDVWIDILVFAGNKCSRESHAKKLNSGGELITILWLMAEHVYQLFLDEAPLISQEDAAV